MSELQDTIDDKADSIKAKRPMTASQKQDAILKVMITPAKKPSMEAMREEFRVNHPSIADSNEEKEFLQQRFRDRGWTEREIMDVTPKQLDSEIKRIRGEQKRSNFDLACKRADYQATKNCKRGEPSKEARLAELFKQLKIK